jgi:hypothetical protein
VRDVVLWDAADVAWDADASERRYVTDVFYRSQRPRPGSLVLGVERTALGHVVSTLALARTTQAVATQKDRVRLEPVVRLTSYVTFDVLADRLEVGQRRRLDDAGWPGPLATVSLSTQLGTAVAAALSDASPEASQLIESWASASSDRVSGRQGFRLREERDAVQLAVDLAGISPPEEMVRPLGTGASSDTLALTSAFDDYFVTDIEDDLIAEDLRRFDPRGTLELRRASVARFQDDDFSLTIMNVNRKPLEKVLGVDLVYWDDVNGVFTLVQYKRLTPHLWEKPSMRATWAFTRRSELVKQLNRMSLTRSRTVNSADWRLTSGPFWFNSYAPRTS